MSLKLRLTLLFLVLSLAAWFAASIVAWHQTTRKLDKLFDTQQMLFAKRLLAMLEWFLPVDVNLIRMPCSAAKPVRWQRSSGARRLMKFGRHTGVKLNSGPAAATQLNSVLANSTLPSAAKATSAAFTSPVV